MSLGVARCSPLPVQCLGDPAERVEEEVDAGPGDADGEDEQDAVDRGLVDLDAEALYQHVLAELVPAQAGLGDVESDPGGVQDELVVLPGLVPAVGGVLLAGSVPGGPGTPVLVRDEVGGVEDGEPAADEPVGADALPEYQGHLVGGADHLKPLQVDLAPGEVE